MKRSGVEQGKRGEIPSRRIAIFIEDEEAFSDAWVQSFTSPDIDCYPSPTREQDLPAFFDRFNAADLSRVALLVIDQRFAPRQLGEFVERFGEVNQDALIVETSGAPYGSEYGGDLVIANGLNLARMLRLIRWRPQAGYRTQLEKLELYSHPEALEAQRADPFSEWNLMFGKRDNFDRFESSAKLIGNERYQELITLMGIPESNFEETLGGTNEQEARDILHDSWNILYHLEIGSKPSSLAIQVTLGRLLDTL